MIKHVSSGKISPQNIAGTTCHICNIQHWHILTAALRDSAVLGKNEGVDDFTHPFLQHTLVNSLCHVKALHKNQTDCICSLVCVSSLFLIYVSVNSNDD